MHQTIPSDFFNFEYVRVLGMAGVHGADVGECLEAAAIIKANDPESWYHAWTRAAETAETAAAQALSDGDREAPEDPRLLPIMEKCVSNFSSATKLFDSHVEPLSIPYGTAKLPGYLYFPDKQKTSGISPAGKVPVVINTNGFDSVQEELYFFTASGAITRGYACLTFDGPGQGIVLRRDGLCLRPDWEVVIAAVLDHLYLLAEKHTEWNLDLSCVALTGAAMGGYLALRGATDERIKACISVDGFYDFSEQVRDRTPLIMRYLSDGVANTVINWASRFNMQNRFEFGHNRLAFGTGSCVESLRRVSKLTLEPEGETPICSRIRCPTLVTAARDSIYRVESKRIFDALTRLEEGAGEKELWDPETPAQGSLQAKAGAIPYFHTKTFGWLDQTFGIKRTPLE
ncbi:hypothetical protein SLS62_008061 [Diatrype stigma]|uniref:Alpha/beta hydrolase n=1 Tax=Diatrype stigma TaxID=117547 RepID=A0AAN9UYD4_9PEZI